MNQTMKWVSTRGNAPSVTLSEAIDRGLAPDGGLYVPESFPHFLSPETGSLSGDPATVLAPFFKGDPLESQLPDLCAKAFNFDTPLRILHWKEATFGILELFHGPTAAFKDVGARFLAECQSRIQKTRKTILVATSGDTGGAVAAAFDPHPQFNVIILFPKNGVSKRQFHQLTCWGPSIRSFAVKGTFDDCQKMVKEAFQDSEFNQRWNLTSANSINAGRLLPQMTYYAKASLEYQKQYGANPGFIIPSGNLGNAVAALWAKQIGYPIGPIILATNANPVISHYFKTGNWKPHPSLSTLANAMDVGNPSNMERVLNLYPNFENLKSVLSASPANDDEIRKAIELGIRHGEVLCPHTATGIHALLSAPRGHWIVVSTAHPAKFETIVEPILGKPVELPESLRNILERKSAYQEIGNTLDDLKRALA